MAHSPITIPGHSDKTAQASKSSPRKAASANTQASFAAMMAREQRGQSRTDSSNQNIQKDQSLRSTATRQARNAGGGIPLRNAIMAGRTPSELLRMQSFARAGSEIAQVRAVDNAARQSAGTGSLDMARNLNAANNLRVIAAGNNGKGFALTSNDFVHTTQRAARTSRAAGRNRSQVVDQGIGKLSAKFESGSDGIAAIGYDSTGGTSYGKYQIASKVGSMKSFLAFLDSEAPDIAMRLRKAGPANTGSRRGAMPDVWRSIAKEQPERFEKLQEAFIHESHYKPALASITQQTGLDANSLSSAMREVIWSTAVQHGPAGAARIFARADNISGKPQNADYERKMITNVYNLRAGQFGSSTHQVRDAVRNRFREERQLALNMLDAPARATRA